MKKVIDVQIGKVRADRGKVILKSKAIGSCIAIVAYDAVFEQVDQEITELQFAPPPPSPEDEYFDDDYDESDESDLLGHLVAGGVGYFIGRHRGRRGH